jgi:hypothetical protein
MNRGGLAGLKEAEIPSPKVTKLELRDPIKAMPMQIAF